MRRPRWLTASAVAFLVPVLAIGFGTAALAASPASSPGTASSANPNGNTSGDPTHGQQVYQASGCAGCHGGALGGGIGPKLRPIQNLGDTKDPLDPAYLTSTITNGKQGVGGYGVMPARGGQNVSDKDIGDLVAYIIQANKQKGPVPLSGGELAKSTVTWVTIGILGMLVLTYLLSRYNMRWIARKAGRRS
jgi:mono/diheme cytochrome c family protein